MDFVLNRFFDLYILKIIFLFLNLKPYKADREKYRTDFFLKSEKLCAYYIMYIKSKYVLVNCTCKKKKSWRQWRRISISQIVVGIVIVLLYEREAKSYIIIIINYNNNGQKFFHQHHHHVWSDWRMGGKSK